MLRLVKYFLLALVLLLVCFSSALLSMRFAIHGREVTVPKFQGLTPLEAERLAASEGLVLSIDERFYSPDVPEGYIVSQSPSFNARVRRGWKVRLAQSLGLQRASIPNVVGESERVAELNISRRGLEIGSVAAIHTPGGQSSIVIAQNPPADVRNAISPKIGLLFSVSENGLNYIMPSFVGQSIGESTAALQQAGFVLGKISYVDDPTGTSGIIVKQIPAAGQKIPVGAIVSFYARR